MALIGFRFLARSLSAKTCLVEIYPITLELTLIFYTAPAIGPIYMHHVGFILQTLSNALTQFSL